MDEYRKQQQPQHEQKPNKLHVIIKLRKPRESQIH